MTFLLSLLHVPLVMAADVCQDVIPMGQPQLEESNWFLVKQRSNGLFTRGEITALLLSVQILFFLSLLLIRRK